MNINLRFRFNLSFIALPTLLVIIAGCSGIKSAAQIPEVCSYVQDLTQPTVIPTPRTVSPWYPERMAEINKRTKQGNVDLLFLGDSITQSWRDIGKDVWQKYYGNRNAVNVGLSGDCTQNVLWRLDHDNINGIFPKVVVLMIGTNNSVALDVTAEDIADGIIAIVCKLREKWPKAKVLLLAIFPRGQYPGAERIKNARASQIASKIADGKMIYYLDIGPKFLNLDGSISPDIMPDYLHLTPEGYQIWAVSMEPTLSKLLN